jgi:hypothetical protein
MEKAGIIRRSNSPWASLLHLVPKKNGSWRPCGNYLRLNIITIPDRYPLSNMQYLNDRMAGCTVFSKIDLVKAFHQIPITEADIPKMVIATPFGLWEFLFMDFGDDRVFSKSREQHWTHPCTLFAILTANGLALNLKKCVFAVSELDFLGHRISAAGVAHLRDNVQVILDFQLTAFISEYTNQLVYVPSMSNVVADMLSRLAAATAGIAWVCVAIADRSPLDLKNMALRQILCPQVQALCSSPGLLIITHRVGDLDLIGDTFRSLVPRDLWRQVFEHLHEAAHPGRRSTRHLISSRYVWKGLSTDVTAWAKACFACQRAKVHRHVQVPPQHVPVPTPRFSHIYVDLVGPCQHLRVIPICSPS